LAKKTQTRTRTSRVADTSGGLSPAEQRAKRWAAAHLKRIPGRIDLSPERLNAVLDAPGLRIEPKHRTPLISAIEKAAWWYSFRKVSQGNPQRTREIERAIGISKALNRALQHANTPKEESGPESASDYKLSTQVAVWLADRASANDASEEAFAIAFARACKAFDEMRWVQAEMEEWARDLALRDAGKRGKAALEPLRVEAIRTLGPYYRAAYGRAIGLSVEGPGVRFLTAFFATVGDRPGSGPLKNAVAAARKLDG